MYHTRRTCSQFKQAFGSFSLRRLECVQMDPELSSLSDRMHRNAQEVLHPLPSQPCPTPPLQGRADALRTVGGELPLSESISANSSALYEHCKLLGLEARIPPTCTASDAAVCCGTGTALACRRVQEGAESEQGLNPADFQPKLHKVPQTSRSAPFRATDLCASRLTLFAFPLFCLQV